MKKIDINQALQSSNDGNGIIPAPPTDRAFVGEVMLMQVTDNALKEYIELLFDITEEGQHKFCFSQPFYEDKPWAHTLLVSYRGAQEADFARFIKAIMDHDPRLAEWRDNEQDLVGKKVVVGLRPEEYVSTNGDIRTRFSRFADYASTKDAIKPRQLKKLAKPKVNPREDTTLDYDPFA